MRIFWAPILKFVLFRSQLCRNVKVSFKKKFCWTIIGGDRIVLRILRLRRMKKKIFKLGKIFCYFSSLKCPLYVYLLIIVFPTFDP